VTTAPLSNAAAGTSAAAPSTASPDQAKLKKAAQAFEAVFVRQLIGSMRSASGDENDGLFDSEATRQFQDMADSKTADAMAQKGALHIADMLVKQYGARMAKTVAPAAGAAPANGLTLVPAAGAAPATAPSLIPASAPAPLALVAPPKTGAAK
jgi:flagellar protein FlgJ